MDKEAEHLEPQIIEHDHGGDICLGKGGAPGCEQLMAFESAPTSIAASMVWCG